MSFPIVHSLWILNKAGGLVYLRSFSDQLPGLNTNEQLVLAGTLHGVHAICSRISPITTSKSSGMQLLESDSFDLTVFLTRTGTKFVLITTPGHPASQALLNRVYEIYADTVMKNPFHIPEMPIRNEMFDTALDGFLRPPDFMT
ncbi:Sybindin-like protein [Wallemia mellicola]|uniref:Trafficking protein particle complex subunit n=2 Tax=Wallemia mellicola TaxID=1708541 RepID=A0A4T0RLE2_9BASI|nr:Sybindin-like protein [Wallemia mellicola CBS 633.66]TIB67261.1 hypothetical protein E3Q24_04210 [Wallemia mellicola]EIM22533.1 Sybindin-like protein [Wallemia mellicola CBS 633.66]TIB76688.1 Sybindin-like protein [Wallemia mellicola]TIB82569.1 Sybindin-like protein [Wallemia mellicola]TIB85294.1 Sybindin-like protein [Wallemia mellicola]|eukprot:XP_006957172.1 Sybindin-like protein [Wallemia mellicola CBS 633.66]